LSHFLSDYTVASMITLVMQSSHIIAVGLFFNALLHRKTTIVAFNGANKWYNTVEIKYLIFKAMVYVAYSPLNRKVMRMFCAHSYNMSSWCIASRECTLLKNKQQY